MFKRAVSEILGPDILTVSPDHPVSAAVAIMAERRVSCLLAVDGGKVAGIMTERDVVRAIRDKLAASTPVRTIMSQPVNGIMAGFTVDTACEMLEQSGVRHLAVLESKGSLRGILTTSNIVDALAVEYMCENIVCSSVMNPKVAVLPPEAPLAKAVDVIFDRHIGSVMAAKDGKPAGTVSERDLTARAFGFPKLLEQPLGEFMRAPAVAVPMDAMVYKVILYMKQKQVRRVAVVDPQGLLVGVMSQSDIVKYSKHFS